ncbi:hypothetical protein VroAM7_50890 (plasmid) [Vibrio rotiferianus]|uniref:Type I restriction modification DNA specificity domain-containing protein n=1 Tax=Vibrio rotiferianus TaxID=190895 RepID=A0A510IJ44_9VIBR|nr:restriction endonuclease subunit S [Vibrio rotiferianus]BBL92436.1 hypothetical protein VroAM7_50890 [Vibrio rotiferianus]
MSFKTYTLGEIASNTSRRFNFNDKEQVCFVNTGDILDGHFLVDEKVSSIGLPGQAKKAIQKGDILYSEIRPGNKRHLLVKTDVDDYVVSTKFMVITCNQDIVIPEYLYLVLTSKDCEAEFKVIADSRSGTFPQITFDAVAYYPIELPSLAQQRAVVEFIESITGKFNLNKLTNQTLEQMAQAIFKSWFVDFDPVKAKMNGEQPEGMDAATASLFPEKLVESELGLIPEGWGVGTLSDVAKYCSARTNTDSISLENYISTENMLAEKKGVTAASKLPTAKTVAAYKSGDILVSNIRPYFKKIWLAQGSGGRSNDVLGFESVSKNTDSYLMNLLYQDTFFEYMTRTSKGAKMPRGDKTAIMNWEMAVPPVELREAFSAIVDKFYQLIPQNRAQNATLESLRDMLLPKLLSGEIELGETEEMAEVN